MPSAPSGKCQLLKPTTNSLELNWPACATAEAYILQIQKVENFFKPASSGIGSGILPPPPQPPPTLALTKPPPPTPTTSAAPTVLSVQPTLSNPAAAVAAAGIEASLLRVTAQLPQQQQAQQQQQIELNQALNSINEAAKLVIQPQQSHHQPQQPLVLTPADLAAVKGSNSIFIGQINGTEALFIVSFKLN